MKNQSLTYRILICDDNIHYSEDLSFMLEQIAYKRGTYSFNIDRAATPTEIRRLIRSNTYDLITLDLCYTNNQQPRTIEELIRDKSYDQLYGAMLFETEIVDMLNKEEMKLSTTKIIAVSNLKESEIRGAFHFNRDLEYFSKSTLSRNQIAQRIAQYFESPQKSFYNSVFIVYGHNGTMRKDVETYLRDKYISVVDPWVDSADGVSSFIDSLENLEDHGQCAIILWSADDPCLDLNQNKIYYQPRPNVLFEMGFFLCKLKKSNLIVIREDHVALKAPSDLKHVNHIHYDPKKPHGWKDELSKRLRKIGFDLDE